MAVPESEDAELAETRCEAGADVEGKEDALTEGLAVVEREGCAPVCVGAAMEGEAVKEDNWDAEPLEDKQAPGVEEDAREALLSMLALSIAEALRSAVAEEVSVLEEVIVANALGEGGSPVQVAMTLPLPPRPPL